MNKEVASVHRWPSCPGTARCSIHQVPLLFRHDKIFSDNFPKTIFFHIQLTYENSDSQMTITTYHPPYLLNIDLSLICVRPPAPRVIFHILMALFELLVPLKTSMCDTGLSPYIFWNTSSICDGVFPNQTKNL